MPVKYKIKIFSYKMYRSSSLKKRVNVSSQEYSMIIGNPKETFFSISNGAMTYFSKKGYKNIPSAVFAARKTKKHMVGLKLL